MLTKKDLSQIRNLMVEVVVQYTQKFSTKSEFKELKNDIAQFKDDILKEIVSLREEVTIVGGFRERIDEHEIRLDKVEKKIFQRGAIIN
jgi:predicted S18 family serine protease